MLSLTADLPQVEFERGDVVIAEGTTTGSIWILVAGTIHVRLGDETISVIDQPGAIIGEISLLLGQEHGATVEALEPTTMRYAADGAQLFDTHPAFMRLVTIDLARRLDSLTVYLADVKRQYRGAPGLSMVSDVLHHLRHQTRTELRPVSARDPEPEY